MATNYNNFFEKDYQKLLEKYDKTPKENKQLKYEYQLLDKKLKTRNKQLEIAINNIEISAKAKYQLGQIKHKLEKFNDEKINDNINYKLDKYPCCGGELLEIGEICKDELSIVLFQ